MAAAEPKGSGVKQARFVLRCGETIDFGATSLLTYILTMSIYDLPTELLLAIGEYCEPGDTYSLALCYRHAHHALSKVLSKYRYWNTIETDDNRKPFHKRIMKLTREQRLTYYVETLSFECELDGRAYSQSEEAEILERLETFRTVHGHVFDEFKDDLWRQNFRSDLMDSQMRRLSTYLVLHGT